MFVVTWFFIILNAVSYIFSCNRMVTLPIDRAYHQKPYLSATRRHSGWQVKSFGFDAAFGRYLITYNRAHHANWAFLNYYDITLKKNFWNIWVVRLPWNSFWDLLHCNSCYKLTKIKLGKTNMFVQNWDLKIDVCVCFLKNLKKYPNIVICFVGSKLWFMSEGLSLDHLNISGFAV